RNEANKTQQQIATELGISRAAYSHFENDRNEPDSETLVKLAKIFNVTIDYLLGNKHTPEWATEDDVIELDKILESDAGMAYGDVEVVTREDRDQINDLIASYFWRKKQKEGNDRK
ncbi:helix-turn-helix transcriptional regulator, partial [Enterococcus hulanensis]|uniref:helix-turn-helix domain-containing protein n=1 Tax=Enterococcus hulanensis TaxID=2559929 RepID=UPI001A8FCA46